MAMPMTRPIQPSLVSIPPNGQLARSPAPTMALPPSNGVRMPYNQGVVHTVKNPSQVVASPVPARVS